MSRAGAAEKRVLYLVSGKLSLDISINDLLDLSLEGSFCLFIRTMLTLGKLLLLRRPCPLWHGTFLKDYLRSHN